MCFLGYMLAHMFLTRIMLSKKEQFGERMLSVPSQHCDRAFFREVCVGGGSREGGEMVERGHTCN